MAEKPILLTGDMVRAVLGGRKTQHRQPMKPQPPEWMSRQIDSGFRQVRHLGGNLWGACCGVGDRLWVQETWGIDEVWPETLNEPAECGYPITGPMRARPSQPHCLRYAADGCDGLWRSAAQMPKWAARIWLEVTGIRAERLQDITEADAVAEGCDGSCSWAGGAAACDAGGNLVLNQFSVLWDSRHAKHGFGWDANPLVWVRELRSLEGRP